MVCYVKKGFILILIIFLQVFFGQCGFAEEVLQNKMNFSEAVKYSLENNNNIRAMRNHLSSTEREIGIARSGLMPKVRVIEGFTVTNNPIESFALKLNQTRATPGDLTFGTLDFPGATTNFLTSGIIEQPLLDRKAMIAIKMAKKEYSANGYTYLRKQEELVSQVAQAYLGVVMAQGLQEVAEKGLKDAESNSVFAEEKYKKNKGDYPDILRIKTDVEEHKENLISAKRKLGIAKRNLGLVLGIQDSVEISSAIPNIKLQDINYYKDFAVYRNDVKATEIRVQNAKNNVQYEQADWYPTLNAIASYNFYNQSYPFGGQGNNYMAGAVFKWEAFDGNKRKYEILKAKDREAEEKEYLAGLKKTVDFKIYEAYTSVEELQENLKIAIEAKKLAEEGAVLIAKRWQKALDPIEALMGALDAVDLARTNLVKCQNDLTLALVSLTYESGIIAQEFDLR